MTHTQTHRQLTRCQLTNNGVETEPEGIWRDASSGQNLVVNEAEQDIIDVEAVDLCVHHIFFTV